MGCNARLDEGVMQHAEKWGCFHNRDIEGLVEEAGAEVVSITRHHYGTTIEAVLRPRKGEATATA